MEAFVFIALAAAFLVLAVVPNIDFEARAAQARRRAEIRQLRRAYRRPVVTDPRDPTSPF